MKKLVQILIQYKKKRKFGLVRNVTKFWEREHTKELSAAAKHQCRGTASVNFSVQ